MLGMIVYTLLIALPTYGLATFVHPFAGAALVTAGVVGSYLRMRKHPGDKQEEGGFWNVAVPAYLFCYAMLAIWFR